MAHENSVFLRGYGVTLLSVLAGACVPDVPVDKSGADAALQDDGRVTADRAFGAAEDSSPDGSDSDVGTLPTADGEAASVAGDRRQRSGEGDASNTVDTPSPDAGLASVDSNRPSDDSGQPPGDAGAPGGAEGDRVSTACVQEGAIRCDPDGGPRRQDCRDGEWVAAASCPEGKTCDTADEENPRSCVDATQACLGSADAKVCQASIMHTCGGNAVSLSEETCKSERHCQLGLENESCALCLPGEHRCDGSTLEKCADDGSGYVYAQTCMNAALCNDDAGACTDTACLPNSWDCDGDALRRCNANQTAFETVQRCDPGMCDQAAGQCDVCVPGSTECSGEEVSTCAADGQHWERSECPNALPHCVGNGKCVECLDGMDEDCGEIGNVGACRLGKRVCVNGSFGACIGQVEPDKESCDGIDSDCDGLTDADDRDACPGGKVCRGRDCVDHCGDGVMQQDLEDCDPSFEGSEFYCDPASCRNRTTYTPCNGDRDCLGNGTCHAGGFCTLACEKHTDCPKAEGYGEWCADGHCIIFCKAGGICPFDFSCNPWNACEAE